MMRRIYTLLLMVLAVQLSSCTTNNPNKQTMPISVKVESAKPYVNGRTTNFTGKVVSYKEVNVAFRVAGTLQNIPVKVGQTVYEGDVIATLDKRDYKTQLYATDAEYRQIKAEAERVIELYNRQSVPKNDYDKAVSALEQITAKRTAHRDALADCSMEAPIRGKIQKISYSEGEAVGAGMPVISIVSNKDFEIETFLPSSFYSNVKGNYFCRIPILSDSSHALSLVSIAPKANANGLYAVRFKIEGVENTKLAVGMRTTIVLDNYSNNEKFVVVPLSAIFERGGENCVWVYDDQTNRASLRRLKVKNVLISGNAVIKEGIKGGEQIVVSGVHSIDENMVLKKLPQDSATNIGGVK